MENSEPTLTEMLNRSTISHLNDLSARIDRYHTLRGENPEQFRAEFAQEMSDAEARWRGVLQAPGLPGPCESPWHVDRALEMRGHAEHLAHVSGLVGGERLRYAYVTAKTNLLALCGIYVSPAELEEARAWDGGCAVADRGLAERLTGLSIEEIKAGDSPQWGPWEIIRDGGFRFIMGYVEVGGRDLHCLWRIECWE